MIVIAHNIRSLHNVGAIFRNSASFGVEKLYLTGISAVPPRKEIAKVALGSQDLVPWEQGEIHSVIERCRREGYTVYGLETGAEAVGINTIKKNHPIALVLGNEVEGIESAVIQQLDGVVQIPMKKKRSLNVSVASGIAMYVLA